LQPGGAGSVGTAIVAVGAVATGMVYLAMVSITSPARIAQQGRRYAAVGVSIKIAISLGIAGGCAIESKDLEKRSLVGKGLNRSRLFATS